MAMPSSMATVSNSAAKQPRSSRIPLARRRALAPAICRPRFEVLLLGPFIGHITKSLASGNPSVLQATCHITNGSPDYLRIIMEIIDTAIMIITEFAAASRRRNSGILIAGRSFAILFIRIAESIFLPFDRSVFTDAVTTIGKFSLRCSVPPEKSDVFLPHASIHLFTDRWRCL